MALPLADLCHKTNGMISAGIWGYRESPIRNAHRVHGNIQNIRPHGVRLLLSPVCHRYAATVAVLLCRRRYAVAVAVVMLLLSPYLCCRHYAVVVVVVWSIWCFRRTAFRTPFVISFPDGIVSTPFPFVDFLKYICNYPLEYESSHCYICENGAVMASVYIPPQLWNSSCDKFSGFNGIYYQFW